MFSISDKGSQPHGKGGNNVFSAAEPLLCSASKPGSQPRFNSQHCLNDILMGRCSTNNRALKQAKVGGLANHVDLQAHHASPFSFSFWRTHV